MSDHASHTAPMPADAPAWARVLFRELHLARVEIEALRASIGLHVVDRREAAEILGCSTKTIGRYEKQGRLPRAHVSKPGAHYFHADVAKLKQAA